MCGIIAIARQKSSKVPPKGKDIKVEASLDSLGTIKSHEDITKSIHQLLIVKDRLTGAAGINALINDNEFRAYLQGLCTNITESITTFELELVKRGTSSQKLETLNADLTTLKDLIWHIERDRVLVSISVEELLAGRKDDRFIEVFLSIQQILAGLDRLEVRGRDSAGVHLMIQNHGLDFKNPGTIQEIKKRANDPSYKSGSIRVMDNALSVVYKVASEIGELGDNTRELRRIILADDLLYSCLLYTSPSPRDS